MKIFTVDQNINSVDVNMRLNRSYADLAAEQKHVIVRVYKHDEGIILGKSQGIDDVWNEYAKSQGVCVSRRDTGGAAVYVNPKDILCYSVFAPTSLLSEKGDQTEVYKKFTFELAKQLGAPVVVGGTYYLQAAVAGDVKPKTFAGHALAIKGKKPSEYHQGFVQIDGMVHINKPDYQRIASLIKLRELYQSPDAKYVKLGGNSYAINGATLKESVIPTHATKMRDEIDELKSLPSLADIGHTEKSFIDALRNASKNIFGEFEERYLSTQPGAPIDIGIEKLKVAIGHCFIYIGETEDKGVLYEAKK